MNKWTPWTDNLIISIWLKIWQSLLCLKIIIIVMTHYLFCWLGNASLIENCEKKLIVNMIHYCYVMFQIFYVGFQDFLFVNIIKNTKKNSTAKKFKL